MKILQVSPGYFPAIGGVEEHVRNISERMAREHEVTVFATDPSRMLPEKGLCWYTLKREALRQGSHLLGLYYCAKGFIIYLRQLNV